MTGKRRGVVLILIILVIVSSIILIFSKLPVAVNEEKNNTKNWCSVDADCICGGIDTATKGCFVGNLDYYKKYVDKTRICPDFCTGITGNLETKCINNTCRLIQGR